MRRNRFLSLCIKQKENADDRSDPIVRETEADSALLCLEELKIIVEMY